MSVASQKVRNTGIEKERKKKKKNVTSDIQVECDSIVCKSYTTPNTLYNLSIH